MNSLLANFDIDKPQNFWKLYPSWKTPEVFNALYKNDKSKDKSTSSLLMWAMVHMFDKSENNPWRGLDSDDRIEVINDDLMNDLEFDWTIYSKEIEYMEKIMMTEEERNYYVFIGFMEKRRKFIENQQDELSFDTLKSLDDAIKRNADVMKELDRLKAAIESSGEEGATKGGRIESLREKGLI